jgi:hypothetical protein
MNHNIVVIENFISEEDAQSIIDEINSPSEVNPYPEHYKNRNGGTALPYNKKVLDLLKKYGDKSNNIHKEINNYSNNIYVTKGYSSKWVTGNHGEPHIDDIELEKFIQWSSVIYLNEPPQFEGGDIYFPQKDFTYTPVKFSAVFFPQQDKSYIHGITKVTAGVRYTLLFHHSSDIQFADPDLI